MAESTPGELFRMSYRLEATHAAPNERAARALEPAVLDRLTMLAECSGIAPEEARDMPLWLLLPRLVLMAPWTAKSEAERRAQGALPLDAELVRIAAAAGKPAVWIESPDQQIAIFKTMPRADVVALLRQVAASGKCVPPDAPDPVVELYLARDLEGMTALTRTAVENAEDPALWRRLHDRLFADRHEAMADRIEAHASAGSVFVAVGAGHLPGPRGLIALLGRRGWTVTPIE
jgi:uncharacterized protein YbaP (TraB family)